LMSVLKKVILNIEFLNGAVLTPISNDWLSGLITASSRMAVRQE
jgi:hypothetical protein